MSTKSNKLVAIEKEIVVTYFRENCPKIKEKEYVEYFDNLTKKSQISGNNLRTKEKGVRNKKIQKINKYEAEIKKCIEKHRIVAPDDKNPANSGQR